MGVRVGRLEVVRIRCEHAAEPALRPRRVTELLHQEQSGAEHHRAANIAVGRTAHADFVQSGKITPTRRFTELGFDGAKGGIVDEAVAIDHTFEAELRRPVHPRSILRREAAGRGGRVGISGDRQLDAILLGHCRRRLSASQRPVKPTT